MRILSTPGVYFRRPSTIPPLRAIRTDVAGFVGLAPRGPVDAAVVVESYNEFTDRFGSPVPWAYLGDAVAGFFENGGRRCHIVRVADKRALVRQQFAVQSGGRPRFVLEAIDPGEWAGDLNIDVTMTSLDRFNLTISYPDGPDEFFSNLELSRWSDGNDDRRASNPRYFARILNGIREDPRWLHGEGSLRLDEIEEREAPISRYVRVAEILVLDPEGDSLDAVASGRLGEDDLSDLKLSDFYGRERGLDVLDLVDEVSMVAIPDMHPTPSAPGEPERPRGGEDRCCCYPRKRNHLPPFNAEGTATVFNPVKEVTAFSRDEIRQLQRVMVERCQQLRDRMAILDVFPALANPQAAAALRREFDSRFAAIYHPWLKVPEPLGPAGALRDVPPAGHVCGVFASVSLGPGVHHAPANRELVGVRDLSLDIGFEEHGFLNDNDINVIKPFEGRGIRLFGARTLSSDSEWRFVNVRRLVTMIEESIEEQIQWAVFEPQNVQLRRDVVRVVSSFLNELWQDGMLDGETRDEAFNVICDDSTTTSFDVDEGRMICDIQLNAPWPAEFVTVRLGLNEGQVNFKEIPSTHAGNF